MNTKSVVVVIALFVALLATSGIGVAQQDPIYNNSTNGTSAQDNWVGNDTEATLDNIVSVVPKGLSYVVAGDAEPNGLVVGLLVGIVVLGIVGVGGSGLTVGLVSAAFTAMAVGVAGVPAWVETTFVIILGILLGVIYMRWGR